MSIKGNNKHSQLTINNNNYYILTVHPDVSLHSQISHPNLSVLKPLGQENPHALFSQSAKRKSLTKQLITKIICTMYLDNLKANLDLSYLVNLKYRHVLAPGPVMMYCLIGFNLKILGICILL